MRIMGRVEAVGEFTRGVCRRGFTLIEVLVVVAIIALLLSILLPSLAHARVQAKASVCLSNLKQVGTGLTMYVTQNRDRYPMHSSLKSKTTALGKPRTRWPDYLHRHMKNKEIYACPTLTQQQRADFSKPWAHNPNETYGGYGFNFQYLGNARHWSATELGTGVPPAWAKAFHAPASQVKRPALTVGVTDVRGSKKGNPDRRFGEGGAAVYVIDPPLGSRDLGSQGSRKNKAAADTNNLWYEGGTDPSEEDLVRGGADDRHLRRTNVAFCDGHAQRMEVEELDGREDGGPGDNRYYNGVFDSTKR